MNERIATERRLNIVESALLYQQFDAVDPAEILKFLNVKPENSGIRFGMQSHNADSAIFVSQDLRIEVCQTRQPLGLDGFASALASPVTRLAFPDAHEKIHQHCMRVFITVGDLTDKSGAPHAYKANLETCTRLTNFMFEQNRPQAIHWHQSNQLVSPQSFKLTLANFEFPTPLYVHPGLFSSNEVINGTKVLGLTTLGAVDLIGKEVIFNEAPVPFHWLYHRTIAFIEMMRNSGSTVSDEDSFGLNKDEVIRIRHCPPSQKHPQGNIALTLEKSGEFPVAEASIPGSQVLSVEPYDADLGPDNPIDRAIITQLKKTAEMLETSKSTFGRRLH